MKVDLEKQPKCPLCGSPLRFDGPSGCKVECTDLWHTCPNPFGCNGSTPQQALDIYMRTSVTWAGKEAASRHAEHRTGKKKSWPEVLDLQRPQSQNADYDADYLSAWTEKEKEKEA